MIAQCKGKDLQKVPKSKLVNVFYVSTKYDGNYIQIHKKGKEVKFFTSGGKEFYLIDLAEELIANNDSDFILECEYIGTTDGKLGSRGRCTTTTFRTRFSKNLPCYLKDGRFMAFNILYYKSHYESQGIEIRKFKEAKNMLNFVNLANSNIDRVKFIGPMTLNEAEIYARQLCGNGYEGLMAISPFMEYRPGKRVNEWVKIKAKPTADLKCISANRGKGKYVDMVGSLVLVDEFGLKVSVGSGLSDSLRSKDITYFLGKTIEIEYEQILDTYINPRFKCIRKDK